MNAGLQAVSVVFSIRLIDIERRMDDAGLARLQRRSKKLVDRRSIAALGDDLEQHRQVRARDDFDLFAHIGRQDHRLVEGRASQKVAERKGTVSIGRGALERLRELSGEFALFPLVERDDLEVLLGPCNHLESACYARREVTVSCQNETYPRLLLLCTRISLLAPSLESVCNGHAS